MRLECKTSFVVLAFSILTVNSVVLADEDDCPLSSKYLCNDGKTCINKGYLCNGFVDCLSDRDDEIDCGKLRMQ